MKSYISVNQRIKFILEKSGMSKKAFSEAANISRQQLDNILANSNTPQIKTIESIANSFNVRLNWLINNEGEPFDYGGIQIPHKEQSQTALNAEKVFDEMKEIIASQRTQIESLTKMLSKAMGIEMGKYKPLELLAGNGVIIPLSVSGVDAA